MFSSFFASSARAHDPQFEERMLAWKLIVLKRLLSGWPRRARSLLVMGPGQFAYLELLYEAGFSVTAHTEEFSAHQALCREKKEWIDYVLSVPDHLPFDDHCFDYAVVVDGFSRWTAPEKVFAELARVCCSGCIVLFCNAFSALACEALLRTNQVALRRQRFFIWPSKAKRTLLHAFGERTALTASTALLPAFCWNMPLLRQVNNSLIPWSFGAVAGVRVDRRGILPGIALPLYVKEMAH